ncbi:MAG: hypothetical protein AB1403_08215 [Candidatus Riflebacteria bacterium]
MKPKITFKPAFLEVTGISLLEVLLGVVIFVLGFVPLLRLFSESGLSQQKIVRDFPVTVSIAERILTTIENEIEEGRFDPAMFSSSDGEGIDITESVVENREVSLALEKFYGTDNQDATQFLSKCRVFLHTEPYSDPNLVVIRVKFMWNDRNSTSGKFKHKIELCCLKNKL